MQATTFFLTALQSNNDLLAARRYLAARYINSGDTEQGIAIQANSDVLMAQVTTW
ncbi:MAG: hypothetical protein ACI9VO_000923 [Colwellia sp.]